MTCRTDTRDIMVEYKPTERVLVMIVVVMMMMGELQAVRVALSG